jgi:hypothetical protein
MFRVETIYVANKNIPYLNFTQPVISYFIVQLRQY